MQFNSIRLIGYGEVGKIFSAGLQSRPGVLAVGAWDLKFSSTSVGAQERAHAAQAGVAAHTSARALCKASGAGTLVISAVTASNTLAVAEAAAQHLQPGSVFLDLNSASPGTKQRCAVLIEACGAHYVEAGVMTSVPPYGIKTPMLLGGPLAAWLAVLCGNWGMDVKAVSEKIGVASAVKMCCSVMIKGLEELVIESYTTARAYGVKRMFYRSLPRPFPASTGHQPEATFSQEWFSMVSAAPKKCVNLPTWSGRQVLSRSSQSRRV